MATETQLENKLEEINRNLAEKIERIISQLASLPSRAEIEAADRLRVSVEAYGADKRGLDERLTRLESNPQRLLVWMGLGVSVLSVLITGTVGFLTLASGMLFFVLTHYKP